MTYAAPHLPPSEKGRDKDGRDIDYREIDDISISHFPSNKWEIMQSGLDYKFLFLTFGYCICYSHNYVLSIFCFPLTLITAKEIEKANCPCGGQWFSLTINYRLDFPSYLIHVYLPAESKLYSMYGKISVWPPPLGLKGYCYFLTSI